MTAVDLNIKAFKPKLSNDTPSVSDEVIVNAPLLLCESALLTRINGSQ
jgi:hypothetical protein